MAKGKHSVALFEVISAGKTSSRSSTLSTPKWWFKKTKPEAPPAAAPATAPMSDSSAPAPRTPGVDLKVDPDYQRIRFNVSYNSAIVAGFTVVVVVGLAYVIGSRMAHGPSSAAAESTAQIRSGPVSPGVLDIAPIAPPRSQPAAIAPAAARPQAAATQTPAAPLAAAPSAPQDPAQRTIGLNYVVFQSYPTEQMANDARDLLVQTGIPATVEVDLKGWGTSAASKYSVVGLKGFDHIKTDASYAAYIKSIEEVSGKFTKNPKYNKFQPAAYSWRQQNTR